MPQYTIHHRPDTKLTPHQTQLKDALIASGESWTVSWYNILVLDERYFEAYLQLRRVPFGRSRKLPPKTQELCLLAINASVTHLHDAGIRAHTAAALKAGASKQEIMEVLELTSVLGIHAVNVGVPLLQEVLAENGQEIGSAGEGLSDRQLALKASFEEQRGYWHSSWDPVLALSPDFFEAYTEFSSVPFQPGHSVLPPKTKELIYTAIDAATTHLYQPGLKLHIRNAVKYGATPEEVMEVLQLAGLMGVQTVLKGADVLVEESGRMK